MGLVRDSETGEKGEGLGKLLCNTTHRVTSIVSELSNVHKNKIAHRIQHKKMNNMHLLDFFAYFIQIG